MRRFLLCSGLFAVLALAAVGCDTGDEDPIGGTMTVNGRTEEVKSALYAVQEGFIVLLLLKDELTETALASLDFAVCLIIPETLLGTTVDLTRPLAPETLLYVGGVVDKVSVDLNYIEGKITDGESRAITVTEGSLIVKRSGQRFSVEMAATLADGNALSTVWKGKALEVELNQPAIRPQAKDLRNGIRFAPKPAGRE